MYEKYSFMRVFAFEITKQDHNFTTQVNKISTNL